MGIILAGLHLGGAGQEGAFEISNRMALFCWMQPMGSSSHVTYLMSFLCQCVYVHSPLVADRSYE